MKYVIRLIAITLFTVPFFASAQLPTLIVCDPLIAGKACTYSSLIELANVVIKFLIVLGASVFSIMFSYAGYLYLTAMGNSSQVSKAHTIFLDAIIGFVIMLAAWLFVDFILTALVKGSNPAQYRLLGK